MHTHYVVTGLTCKGYSRPPVYRPECCWAEVLHITDARHHLEIVKSVSMSLHTLPAELLSQVASYLDPISFGFLRLASRLLHHQIFQVFVDRVIAQRWALIPASLKTLRAAASDERLQPLFKTFRLSTHQLFALDTATKNKYREILNARGETFKSDNELSMAIIVEFSQLPPEKRARMRDPEYGQSCVPPDGALIASTLDAMPALRTIEVGEWCSPGDTYDVGHGNHVLDADPLFRLCPLYEEISYRECPESDPHSHKFARQHCQSRLSKSFQLVLDALSISGSKASKLERLSALLYGPCREKLKHPELERQNVLTPVQLNELSTLEQGSASYTALRPALWNLQELRLALRVDRDFKPTHVCRDYNQQSSTWLTTFLTLTPRLQALQLWFDGYSGRPSIQKSSAYDWSCHFLHPSHETFASFCSGTRLRCLASLELGNVVAELTQLQIFIQCHAPSLKSLRLAFVTLVERHKHISAARCLWSNLIADLAWTLPALANLTLQCLYEKDIHSGNYRRSRMRLPSTIMLFAGIDGDFSHFTGCDRCTKQSQHTGCMGELPSCGHAQYESREGRWPAMDTMRAYEMV